MIKDNQTLNDVLFIGFTIMVVSTFIWANFFYIAPYEIEARVNLADKALVSVYIDQPSYSPGETVKIAVVNRTDSSIGQIADDGINLNNKNFIGYNYGIGLIEMLVDGKWNIVEPIWRCAGGCFEHCDYNENIESGKAKIFEWKQTIMDCQNPSGSADISTASPGQYRVSTAIKTGDEEDYYIILSPTFIIN